MQEQDILPNFDELHFLECNITNTMVANLLRACSNKPLFEKMTFQDQQIGRNELNISEGGARLTFFEFRDCHISSSDIRMFEKFPQLKRLTIFGNKDENANLFEPLIGYMIDERLQHLSELTLSGSHVQGAHLNIFKDLKQIRLANLQTLKLSDNKIGNDGFVFLMEGLAMLQDQLINLELDNNSIDGSGLVAFSQPLVLHCITRLQLRKNQFHDIHVGQFLGKVSLPNLIRLDLRNDSYQWANTQQENSLLARLKEGRSSEKGLPKHLPKLKELYAVQQNMPDALKLLCYDHKIGLNASQ